MRLPKTIYIFFFWKLVQDLVGGNVTYGNYISRLGPHDDDVYYKVTICRGEKHPRVYIYID